MNFEFATAGRILFGRGRLKEVGEIARRFGRRALVVTGRETGRAVPLTDILHASGVEAHLFPAAGEPSIQTVEAATEMALGLDMVIAMGGGSVIDTAKAVAALRANGGRLLDYLEVIGRNKPLRQPSIPCIAIPTTAGTGAEVTRNSVLGSPEHKVKVSLRGPTVLPRVAVVDPELTLSLPPHVTAFTGMDALTQLIEPFTCNRANPLTDALCREGMKRVARSLPAAFHDGSNMAAREDMCAASLFGGLALANAGLGAVHGFAGPIGGMFDAPHGALCAALLPRVMHVNQRALRAREPQGEVLRRYDEVARILTGRQDARAEDGVQWVEALVTELKIPALQLHGIQPPDFPAIIEKAQRSSSMKANPVQLTAEELNGALEKAL